MMDAVLKSRSFREAREADWRRLENLLDRLERGSLRRLTDDELTHLPVLYRSTLSSLSIARAISLDRALIDYLESLSTRAYFVVYGVRARPLDQAARFFLHDWPQAVRALWRETIAAGLLGVAGALVAFILVRRDPDWFGSFIDPGLAAGRGPDASTASLRADLYAPAHSGLEVLASFLFTHNAQTALYAFALGFAFCVPTALLAAANGAALGALAAIYVARGLGFQLWGWLLIHGVTELWAITLAAAAGFRLGVALIFPGPRTRGRALAVEGRRATTVMAGVFVMLFVAALLEGFGRQLITGDAARYAVAATSGALWCAYFGLAAGLSSRSEARERTG